ncbi:MAG TPA: hypothetical protein VN688_07855 [Gemmataceae bacterium]|nr:hypothetical protein [Gemmataceae bacterium]
MLSPGYVSAPPVISYPAPAYVPQQNRVPAMPAPRAAAAVPARPLVRAKAPDEPIRSRPPILTMPSPEQLGVVVRSAETAPDWPAIHARIKELGIVSFHMGSLPDGRACFTCWVPRGQPGLTQRIEVTAANEAEAIRLGLERAGQSRASRP